MPDPRPAEVFFVVGCARSGTTLLQAMLSRAPGVYMPPETKFLTFAERFFSARRRPDPEAAWREALAFIEERSRIEGMDLDPAALLREGEAGEKTPGAAFKLWLRLLARRRGVSHIGEKSPAHSRYVFELLAMFPRARAVHILRDPRDVAASFEQSWGAPALQGALRWRRAADQHLRCRALLGPERYASVHYERLVRQPEVELRRICAFLGLDFRPAMLHPERREHRGFSQDEPHKQGTLHPITTTRIGRYSQDLTPARVALVETVCGGAMREIGYEPLGARSLDLVVEAPRQALRLLLSRARFQLRARRGWVSRMPVDREAIRRNRRGASSR